MPSSITSTSSIDEVKDIDDNLKQVEKDILRLEKKLAALKDKAVRLRDRRRSLTVTAPWITRLPPDILAQIFIRGTKSHSSSTTDVQQCRVFLPISVSQVSKQWRKVALQLPQLWNYIDMSEGRPYNRTYVWLKRSRNLPLDISIDYRNEPDSTYYQRNFLVTLNVVIPYIYRWGSIRVIAPESLLETALHVFSAPAPMLHTLVLKGWSRAEDDRSEQWAPTIFHRNTPALKNVHLHGIALKWESCVFSEMRDCTLSWIPADTVYKIPELAHLLRLASPCLQRLSIIASPARPRGDGDVNNILRRVLPYQVSLPRMQELRLESLDLIDVQTLFPLFQTPSLRKLILTKIVRGSGKTSDLAAWRATDWRPDLDYLEHLECTDLDVEGGRNGAGLKLFEAVARSAPNIRRLSIRGASASAILEFLTPELLLMLPDEDILLPNLERLEVHDTSAETVRAFVESRTSNGHTKLREVTGSIQNEKKMKRSASGREAVQQLGWEHNDAIHVALRPVK